MKIRKLGVLLLALICVFQFSGIQVYAATVGEQLLEPESGWKRYDDTDTNIIYEGNFSTNTSPELYNGSVSWEWCNGQKIKFAFNGSKLRLYAFTDTKKATNISISIDGVEETFTELYNTGVITLVYEKNNLDFGVHNVEIVFPQDSSKNAGLDAIDIDDTGELIGIPNAPINLSATPGNTKVDLAWDDVQYADSYKVLRATTAGGPYVTIAENILGISYTDTDVVNDTTYYYVVVAVNFLGESANSNEVSATPEAPPSNNALLRITMINGTINEYDLSMTDIADFIDWYDDRAKDIGKEYYIIDKTYNIGPFTSRKDYIIFNKILQFEVMEYN